MEPNRQYLYAGIIFLFLTPLSLLFNNILFLNGKIDWIDIIPLPGITFICMLICYVMDELQIIKHKLGIKGDENNN